MDKEDITFVSQFKERSCDPNRRRRREVHHRNKRSWWGNFWGGIKNFFANIGEGAIKVVDSVVTAGAGILGIETVNSPLMCLIEGGNKMQVNTQYMRNPDIAYVLKMEYGGDFRFEVSFII